MSTHISATTNGWSFNPAGRSKDTIATYLRDNIQNVREHGLNILDVNGEQILIETEERGAEWVDVVESAGSPGAKWQWLCQLLGLAGQTGRATAPHLHYEVRVDGRAVDPLQE